MDESWRVSIGSMVPRRRSMEETRRRRGRLSEPGDGSLDPDDFRDVFGGPPRTVLHRRFSGELSAFAEPRSASSFYDEVFRPPHPSAGSERPRAYGLGGGRSLPGFRIPAAPARGAGLVRPEEGFYDDIFGSDGHRGGGDWRSRSRSKSKSSSVLSSEDVSPPLRAATIAEDAVLSSFASKLRPITIPSRRHISSPPSTISIEEQSTDRTSSINPHTSNSCFLDSKDSRMNNNHSSSDVYRQRSHIGFPCCFSPPETMSLEASFRGNYMKPLHCENSDADSPSSVISSIFLDPVTSKAEREVEKMVMEVEGEGEAAESSYTIEIDKHGLEGREGAAAVDEAIAWAKQKFWNNQTSKGVEIKEEAPFSMESKDVK